MKTSVDIPDDLWKAAKILAVEDNKDLRDVIIEALQQYLGKKAKARDKGGKEKWRLEFMQESVRWTRGKTQRFS